MKMNHETLRTINIISLHQRIFFYYTTYIPVHDPLIRILSIKKVTVAIRYKAE